VVPEGDVNGGGNLMSTLISSLDNWKRNPVTPLLSHFSAVDNPGRVQKVSMPSEAEQTNTDGNKFWQEVMILESYRLEA